VITAGGDLAIQGADVDNLASTISSGGNLVIQAATIENEARALTRQFDLTKTKCGGFNLGNCNKGYRGTTTLPPGSTPAGMEAAGAFVALASSSFANTGTVEANAAAVTAPTILLGLTNPHQATPIAQSPAPVIDLSTYFTVPPVSAATPAQVSLAVPRAPVIAAPAAADQPHPHSPRHAQRPQQPRCRLDLE
jgi:adhesin HecA-like repeat protein